MMLYRANARHRSINPGSLAPAPETERRAKAPAVAGALGGAILFLDLSLHAFRPLGQAYFFIASLMALCLPCVPATFWLRGLISSGWRRGFAVVGTALVGLGATAWLAAFVLLFGQPHLAFIQHLTPGGSALMSAGMILFGIAVLTSRKLSGWGAALPLAVGAYFPLQLIVQLMFFLNGKDDAPGPNGFILGAWGLVWIAAAWTGAKSVLRTAGSAPAGE